MFWRKSGRATPEERPGDENQYGPIEIERDAERPATIVRVATELERRGAEVVEFFKVLSSPKGQAKIPIYLRWREQDFFVEVETRPWTPESIDNALANAAVLRNSEYHDAGMGLLSAYPVPENLDFFFSRSTAALFQLEFFQRENGEDPEATASSFLRTCQKKWQTYLGYEINSLLQIENFLLEALYEAPDPGASEEGQPVLESLVEGLGCYVGEVVRRNSSEEGSWVDPEKAGEKRVLELGGFVLDPIGKARAFLHDGAEDSTAYYAKYVLEALGDSGLASGRNHES